MAPPPECPASGSEQVGCDPSGWREEAVSMRRRGGRLTMACAMAARPGPAQGAGNVDGSGLPGRELAPGMRDGCECWERRQRGVDGAGSGCVSGVGLRGMRDGCECWERRQRGVDGAGSGCVSGVGLRYGPAARVPGVWLRAGWM
ncbi:hypothetical protein CYMTET_22313 [Cymbomonas tetramitiformis]|uniref:Uncharacterized protein n=1 Tax=Cymbomonas tetramitiformis TaxID=36881 RepID=A0AAE0G0A7_9CHLO|nr:hypothetical protein CYMTET_22313 [Cymbomonas tetramitiformis]